MHKTRELRHPKIQFTIVQEAPGRLCRSTWATDVAGTLVLLQRPQGSLSFGPGSPEAGENLRVGMMMEGKKVL